MAIDDVDDGSQRPESHVSSRCASASRGRCRRSSPAESIPHPDAEQARTRLNQLISAAESPAEASAAPATRVPST